MKGTCFPHFEKCVEVQSNWQNHENPSAQQKFQVCVAINVNVKCLYGAETWRMNKTTLRRIQKLISGCGTFLEYTGEGTSGRERNQVEIEMDMFKRRWGWLCHTLKKPNCNKL